MKNSLLAFIILTPLYLLGWSVPNQISDSGINFNANAVINPAGDAEAVWTKGTYPNLFIQSATYAAGSWTVPVTISTVGVNDGAQVGIDTAGNAVAVWNEATPGGHLIQASTKPFGGSWSAPLTLSSGTLNFYQKLTMNGAGEVICGWINYDTNSVQVAHLTFGGGWSAPIVISTVSGVKSNLVLGIDTINNGFAAWTEGNGEDIYASNSTGTVWPVPVNLNKNGNNGSPALSVGASGQCLVAWTNNEVVDTRATWCNSGTWSFIPRIISGDLVGPPAVGARLGNGFASWLNKDTGFVQTINYFTGEWAHPPLDVSSSTNNDNPTVSVDSTNTAIIAWPNFTAGVIEATRFPSAGVPEAAQSISGVGDHYFPLASSGGTNSIVIWQSSVGSDWLIFVNIN